MNKLPFRQKVLAGVTVAALGLSFAGAGIASAASTNASSGQSDLITKIASTFHIDKDKVAEVFAADRQERQAQMQADQAAKLAQAVTDGKLTQAQADYITNAQKDLQTAMGSADPGSQTDDQKAAIKEKMDALQAWAKTNNIDAQYLGHGGGHGETGGSTPPSDAQGRN